MVYKISWTLKAVDTYISILDHLETEWTRKEVDQFILAVEKRLLVLTKFPRSGAPRNKRNRNIRFLVIHKRISLIYRINERKKNIELLVFWNSHQNPKELKLT
jgi:plasmid stabilization system protein ParE